MAQNESREDLQDYILRALGSPVINIELDPSQIEDRIDDTIQLFIKRHYLGVEETIFAQTIGYQDLLDNSVSLPVDIMGVNEVFSPSSDSNTLNNSGIAAFDSLEYQIKDAYNSSFVGDRSSNILSYYLAREHFSTIRHLFETRKQFSHSTISHKLCPLGWSLNDIRIYNLLRDEWASVNSNIETNTTSTNTASTKTKVGRVSPHPSKRYLYSKTSLGSNSTPNIVFNGIPSSAKTTRNHASAYIADKIVSLNNTDVFGVSQIIDRQHYSISDYSMAIVMKSEEYTGNVTVNVTDEDGAVLLTQDVILTDYFKQTHLSFSTEILNKAKIKVEIISSSPASTAGDGFSISSIEVWRNPDLVMRGYKAVSEEDSDLWNDDFVKRYAVAVCGMQWADNLSKFAGVQLPGAITLDGPSLYSKYLAERDMIMSDFESSSVLPLDPIIA